MHSRLRARRKTSEPRPSRASLGPSITKWGSRTPRRIRSWNGAKRRTPRAGHRAGGYWVEVAVVRPPEGDPPCASVRLRSAPVDPPRRLDPSPLQWEHTFVPLSSRSHLAKEEIEQLRRSIAMLPPGSMAMTREDAVRLLGELGEVRGRLDRLCKGLRALIEADD